ncbi:MAG: 3'-5' exonuclease, partial [bacterium]|nr:3'-5' exonuclease [bacterium]
ETRWRYLHIDEYQDTNMAQYELSKLLAAGHRNICVVGDSDQNIYGWRGANLRNIMNFEKDYPGAQVVLLEENYRSTQNILAAANEVIRKNTVRKDKTLFTKNKTGEKLGLFEAFDEEDEARFVAGKMAALKKAGVPYKKMAVLYRANFQSRAFEEALFARGIPYQVLGVRFFERKEVKDVLSYLRLVMGGESAIDVKRALQTPARGLGKVALVKILSKKEAELPPKGKEELTKWRMLIADLAARATTMPPSALVKETLRRSGLEGMLKDGTEEEKERLENMYELASIAARYDSLPAPEGLEQFLEDAALFSDQDSLKEGGEGAKLLTVHSAKGLEFSHVFVVGLEQDLFPHAKPLEHVEKEEAEEERRLFYVALTRAEEKLYLSFAMMRTIFGSKQVNEPSEFIFDIPPDLFEKETREEGGKVIYLE